VFDLFRKRKLWLPTWQFLLIAGAALALAAWLFFSNIHSFLSVTEPADGANVLVIEGWISDDILARQLEGFEPGKPYDYVCTIGPNLDYGHYLSEYETFAELAAKTVEKLGVPAENIIAAPSAAKLRDRTYHAALGFKEMRDSGEIDALRDSTAIDVLSNGAHGRRTRTVFRKLLGDEVQVGILSPASGTYDPDRWFASSQGVKTVIIELISLAYEWSGLADR
jgi:hypothetical protein